MSTDLAREAVAVMPSKSAPLISAPAPSIDANVLEMVLLQGDLKALKPIERVNYYRSVCQSLGLNQLTRPFEYIALNGKLQLYAKKDCTDQLRQIHGVSISIPSREVIDGCFVVTAIATLPSGRCDSSLGAVGIEGLKGEARSNAMMKAECVPLDSEILTRSGWRKYDQVAAGDEVLAYDCDADECRWTALLAITVHEGLPMVRLCSDGEQFDIRCTPDHSWAIRKLGYVEHPVDGSRGPRGPYRNRRPDRLLVKANELLTSHGIILSAPERDTTDSVLSPTEAAILGWAVTDGTIQKRGSHRRVGICQSKEENFEHIRELVADMVPSGVREIVSAPRVRTFPMSGRTYATLAQHWWYLPAQVSRDLLNKAGFEEQGRSVLPNLAARLSPLARRAMLQAMMLAEGDKKQIFANTDRNILDTFQILCALEGHATGAEHDRKVIITQRLKKTRHVSVSFLKRTEAGIMPAWCPTTEFGTWVMRQNGRVMITGNTKAKRRATLSICGLAVLDESEVGSTDAVHVKVDPATGEILEGTREAQKRVAKEKIAELGGDPSVVDAESEQHQKLVAAFATLYAEFFSLGHPETFRNVLIQHGVHFATEFEDTPEGLKAARKCYKALSLPLAQLRHPEPDPETNPAEEMKSVTDANLGGTFSIKGCVETFGKLKERFVAACGASAGEAEYRRILLAHGVPHSNKFRSAAEAAPAIAEMLASLKAAEEMRTE